MEKTWRVVAILLKMETLSNVFLPFWKPVLCLQHGVC